MPLLGPKQFGTDSHVLIPYKQAISKPGGWFTSQRELDMQKQTYYEIILSLQIIHNITSIGVLLQ